VTPRTGSGVTRSTGEGRPGLVVVSREGDARGALAVAVSAEGLAPDRGAVPAVALAALVEARATARGLDASAVGGWGSWRLRALVASPAEAARAVEIVRDAMLAPVQKDEPALAAVTRKLSALARRALPDRALVGVARCTGEAFGTGGDAERPTAEEIEGWRRAAHVLGRVAVATAGDEALADAAAGALAGGPAWPGATTRASNPDAPDGRAVVYDASGEVAPGAARVVVTAWTPTPEQAVAAAPALGDPRGPLASRLAALEAPARVRSVVATAHADGGCVAATVDLAARDLAAATAARLATAAALARQEIVVELADTTAPSDLGHGLALRAPDPREAAERAAWWALSGRRSGASDDLRVALTVGVAAPRDGAPTGGEALRAEIDRATIAWQAPAVEAHTHVERGQGEVWILLASACGTLGETTADAGAGAVVATAAAAQASGTGDERVEPFVATDGVGVLAHGAARPGEGPQAHARRLADVASRAFAADPLDAVRVAQARTTLLARVGELDVRAVGTLGAALAPGRPSWVEPLGSPFGLSSASEEAIALRAAAMRAGPLRVAVLANADDAQARAAVRAVDRWIARRPGEARACPPAATLSPPRTGTYAVDVPAGASSEALLAFPLPAGDEVARAAAAWLAAALEGPDGLLAHALGAAPGDPAEGALARAWSAGVLGAPRSPALAVRVVALDASLDRAVAQTRALLDRVRQGALRDEDRARAASAMARAALSVALDPRARTIDLWRGEAPSPAPSLDALRAFAAATLHDDALVITAARPPRVDPTGRPFTGPAPRAKSRDR
jgi:hypothetical protein